jgi:hypothetical protein
VSYNKIKNKYYEGGGGKQLLTKMDLLFICLHINLLLCTWQWPGFYKTLDSKNVNLPLWQNAPKKSYLEKTGS